MHKSKTNQTDDKKRNYKQNKLKGGDNLNKKEKGN